MSIIYDCGGWGVECFYISITFEDGNWGVGGLLRLWKLVYLCVCSLMVNNEIMEEIWKFIVCISNERENWFSSKMGTLLLFDFACLCSVKYVYETICFLVRYMSVGMYTHIVQNVIPAESISLYLFMKLCVFYMLEKFQ